MLNNPPLSLTFVARTWQLIDAAINASVAIASADGHERAVVWGERARRAGWSAAEAHPRRHAGRAGWPPLDDDLTITLPVSVWRLLEQDLSLWSAVREPRDEGLGSITDRLRQRLDRC